MDEEKENRDELVEKARTQYGITNADQMSTDQIRHEIELIKNQSKTKSNKPNTKQ